MFSPEFKRALEASTPTFFAYFPLGLLFGVLFSKTEFHWLGAPIMSALLYAGAVQFVALSMMANNASLLAIILAALFVALRNSFYGLSVAERFKPAPKWMKPILMFGLVDAAYAVFVNRPIYDDIDDIWFCFHTTILMYAFWVIGTFVGAVFAHAIPDVSGMSFILTAFFFLIVLEYLQKNKSIDALIIPVIASAIAWLIVPHYFLLIAISLCAVYLYIKVKVIYD